MRSSLGTWPVVLGLLFVVGCGDSGSTVGDTSSGDTRSSDTLVTPDLTSTDTGLTDALALDTEDPTDIGDDVPEGPDWVFPDIPPRPDVPRMDIQRPDLWAPPDSGIPVADIQVQSHCSPAGDDEYNIYDLQDPACPDHPSPEPTTAPGLPVVLEGVVVTGVFSDTVFVQEEDGGPYSALAVYFHGEPTDQVVVGDRVTVEGGYREFYDLTQVWLTSLTKHGAGEPPAPYVVAHPSHIATDGPNAEMLESVLVEVHDVWVTSTNPDCPKDFGEALLAGGLRVDDMAERTWVANIGDHLERVTGNLYYAFGNSKIEPRTDDDVVLLQAGGGGLTKCFGYECIVALEARTTDELVVNEIMADPYGDDGAREYLEVYNPNAYVIDLRGWKLLDCGGQQHVIESDEGVRVPAKGYAVLGPIANPDENGGVPVDYAWGGGFYLPNTVGSVLLVDPAGALVDQVRYEAFEPWPFELGHSIELGHPSLDNRLPENWQLATVPYGDDTGYGTPGFANGE